MWSLQGLYYASYRCLYNNFATALKSLAPKYEELGKVFAGEKGVLIGKVDATEHGDLASK